MGEKKFASKIPKDWFLQVDSPGSRRRMSAVAERKDIQVLADIPEYLSAKQVAEKLNSNHKTVADWMAKRLLKSVKIRGRRRTTAKWLQDFIDREDARNG